MMRPRKGKNVRIIRILRPEDVTLVQPTLSEVNREEAEAHYQRALAAAQNLKEFVENRDRQLFPEFETSSSSSRPRRIGFLNW